MSKLIKKVIPVFLIIYCSSFNLFAQCAMCRVGVENNVSAGENSFAAGLNTGILYLMVMPYLILMFVGYAWYKKSRQESASRDKISNILKAKLGS
ncbi:hypothetical protein [Flexithrix dorotheae]|uniref:hypothetical protein n=1 Tax=Flexithrix dorotheae TaxID=70993 RepID=UPI0005C791A7|nr:hypothetical protein [Flexithrix dorotheae]